MSRRVFDALVLAGGTGRRLGGVDKPGLLVRGRPLLDHVLLACREAQKRVVVGPVRATSVPAQWVQEDVAFGGPVAALATGLEATTSELVVLLAADLPFLDTETVDLLVRRRGLLVAGGRDQWLCGAWRTEDLRTALAGRPVVGARLRDVLAPLVSCRIEVDDRPCAPWTDVDTPQDLAAARSSAA